jgi:hypothetical protein
VERQPCVFPSWEKTGGRYAAGRPERLPAFSVPPLCGRKHRLTWMVSLIKGGLIALGLCVQSDGARNKHPAEQAISRNSQHRAIGCQQD